MSDYDVHVATYRLTSAFQEHNDIADQGASAIAKALKTNTCLTKLNVRSTGASDI